MSGRILAIVLILSGLLAGAAMYWLQVYAYYDEARLVTDGGTVEMTVTTAEGDAIPLPVRDFAAIDATSSPIRFRACFTTGLPQDAALAAIEDAVPLNAPGWFDCFDAAEIGADLASGAARAYLGQANVIYGIDRVLAIYPDGRGFAWHRINACGEEVFDGNPAPEGCPPPPAPAQEES